MPASWSFRQRVAGFAPSRAATNLHAHWDVLVICTPASLRIQGCPLSSRLYAAHSDRACHPSARRCLKRALQGARQRPPRPASHPVGMQGSATRSVCRNVLVTRAPTLTCTRATCFIPQGFKGKNDHVFLRPYFLHAVRHKFVLVTQRERAHAGARAPGVEVGRAAPRRPPSLRARLLQQVPHHPF